MIKVSLVVSGSSCSQLELRWASHISQVWHVEYRADLVVVAASGRIF